MVRRRYSIDFPHYLAECEYNYSRLRRLMPGCRQVQLNGGPSSTANEGREWSYLTGEQSLGQGRLVLRTHEITRYTTTVHISIESQLQKPLDWFKNFKSKKVSKQSEQAESTVGLNQNNPWSYSLDVRLYHDAHVAEVLSFDGYRRILPRHSYPNPCMHQQDEKAQLNTFLGELLDHCLFTGRVDKQFSFS